MTNASTSGNLETPKNGSPKILKIGGLNFKKPVPTPIPLKENLSAILNLNTQDLQILESYTNEDLVIIGTLFPQKLEDIKDLLKNRKTGKEFFKNILKKYGFLASWVIPQSKGFINKVEEYFDILDSVSSHQSQIAMKEFARKLMGKNSISVQQYTFLYNGIQDFYRQIVIFLLEKIKKESDITKLYKKVQGYEKEIFEEKIIYLKKPSKSILYFIINNFEQQYKAKAFDLFKKYYKNDLFELAKNCPIITFQALGEYKKDQKNRNCLSIDQKYDLIKDSQSYRYTKGEEIFEMPLKYKLKGICEIEDKDFTNRLFENIQSLDKDTDYITSLRCIVTQSKTYNERAGTLILQNYQSSEDLIFIAKRLPKFKEAACRLMIEKFPTPNVLVYLLKNSKEVNRQAGELLFELCKSDKDLGNEDKQSILYLTLKSCDSLYEQTIALLVKTMDNEEMFNYVLNSKEGHSIVWETLKTKNITSKQLREIINSHGIYSTIAKEAFEILKTRPDNINHIKSLIEKGSYHTEQCVETILENTQISKEDIIWLLTKTSKYISLVWDKLINNTELIDDEILISLLQVISQILINEKEQKQQVEEQGRKEGEKILQLRKIIYNLELEITRYIKDNHDISCDFILKIATSKGIVDSKEHETTIKQNLCGYIIEKLIQERQKLRRQVDLSQFKYLKIEIGIDVDVYVKIFRCVPSINNLVSDFCDQMDINEQDFRDKIMRTTLKNTMK